MYTRSVYTRTHAYINAKVSSMLESRLKHRQLFMTEYKRSLFLNMLLKFEDSIKHLMIILRIRLLSFNILREFNSMVFVFS